MNHYDYHIDFVKGNVAETDRLIVMAEEAAELSQACLKLARYYRGQWSGTDGAEKLWANIEEEFADLNVCADALDMEPDADIMCRKAERWHDRWNIEHAGEVNK